MAVTTAVVSDAYLAVIPSDRLSPPPPSYPGSSRHAELRPLHPTWYSAVTPQPYAPTPRPFAPTRLIICPRCVELRPSQRARGGQRAIRQGALRPGAASDGRPSSGAPNPSLRRFRLPEEDDGASGETRDGLGHITTK